MKAVLGTLSSLPRDIDAASNKAGYRWGGNAPSQSFWIDVVLEPLHGSMQDVHAIYYSTFTDVLQELRQQGPSSLNSAISLLSDRHFESRDIRGTFSALRSSVEQMPNRPPEIREYVDALEDYFLEAAMNSVSPPMRTLLENLKGINKLAMSEGDLTKAADSKVDALREEARENVSSVLEHIDKAWDSARRLYFSARLKVLQKNDQLKRVMYLLKKRKELEAEISPAGGPIMDFLTKQLASIDAELSELTKYET